VCAEVHGCRTGDLHGGPTTVLHTEIMRSVLQIAVSCASHCMLRLKCSGGGGEQKPFPHVWCRFGVVLRVPLLATSTVPPHSCSGV